MQNSESLLEKLRKYYQLPLPSSLKDIHRVCFSKGKTTSCVKDEEELRKIFPRTFGQPILHAEGNTSGVSRPLRIGVVLSGGQAPGGHNVIAGLFDALKTLHSQSVLLGFLDGPSGIITSSYKEITEGSLAAYRNQGGFDLIGSGRTKIETPEQLQASLSCVQNLKLDGLVIIGGDDSNTNAAILAEYFLEKGCETKVIGVPKTIDGDLKNSLIETSFGFDTACKIYSEMIGNIARDALSAKKYYHFIKLMGRSASHIALECALATHPNIAIIGEEVAFHSKTLLQIANEICDVICKRAELGKNYGIILIPEGLIEFIPEIGKMIAELNALGADIASFSVSDIVAKLTPETQKCFSSMPESIQKQLLLDRDPHGNVQVSQIETERLLMEIVGRLLKERKNQGTYSGKFSPVQHFFGYEGRAGFPSNFDCHYCYALGMTAALLIHCGFTGYMSAVRRLRHPVSEWQISGIPITMLMNLEKRHGKVKPVIQKALVDLKGAPFSQFQREREKWSREDHYRFPGPIQFFGDPRLTEAIPLTLYLETS